MLAETKRFTVRLARSPEDIEAAQRLRYEVFIEELGGSGPLVDHARRLERDAFDPHFDHLLLVDEAADAARGDHVIGVYRLLRCEVAREIGRFYSEDEYDLAPLRASGRRLLELGRSCVRKPHRGGAAMFHLWAGLADYVARHEIEVLFGVASFHGTDAGKLALPLSHLHHRHLAPPALRVRAQEAHFEPMDLLPEEAVDRRAAMQQMPALIKAYLRLGGFVGEGAFIDRAFNTVDVCLIMDTANMNQRQADIYRKGRR